MFSINLQGVHWSDLYLWQCMLFLINFLCSFLRSLLKSSFSLVLCLHIYIFLTSNYDLWLLHWMMTHIILFFRCIMLFFSLFMHLWIEEVGQLFTITIDETLTLVYEFSCLNAYPPRPPWAVSVKGLDASLKSAYDLVFFRFYVEWRSLFNMNFTSSASST